MNRFEVSKPVVQTKEDGTRVVVAYARVRVATKARALEIASGDPDATWRELSDADDAAAGG